MISAICISWVWFEIYKFFYTEKFVDTSKIMYAKKPVITQLFRFTIVMELLLIVGMIYLLIASNSVVRLAALGLIALSLISFFLRRLFEKLEFIVRRADSVITVALLYLIFFNY